MDLMRLEKQTAVCCGLCVVCEGVVFLFCSPVVDVEWSSKEIIDARMALPLIANPRRSSTHQCWILSKILVSSDIPNKLKIRPFLRHSPDQVPARRVVHTKRAANRCADN